MKSDYFTDRDAAFQLEKIQISQDGTLVSTKERLLIL